VATHKSAEKRARQRTKRNLRNKRVLGSLRTTLKKARAAVDAKKKDVKDSVAAAISEIDAAVSKRVMHRKKASRLISRLARRNNAAASAAAAPKAEAKKAPAKAAPKAKKPAAPKKK
jgi:small subunit ribosomal protein S20